MNAVNKKKWLEVERVYRLRYRRIRPLNTRIGGVCVVLNVKDESGDWVRLTRPIILRCTIGEIICAGETGNTQWPIVMTTGIPVWPGTAGSNRLVQADKNTVRTTSGTSHDSNLSVAVNGIGTQRANFRLYIICLLRRPPRGFAGSRRVVANLSDRNQAARSKFVIHVNHVVTGVRDILRDGRCTSHEWII